MYVITKIYLKLLNGDNINLAVGDSVKTPDATSGKVKNIFIKKDEVIIELEDDLFFVYPKYTLISIFYEEKEISEDL